MSLRFDPAAARRRLEDFSAFFLAHVHDDSPQHQALVEAVHELDSEEKLYFVLLASHFDDLDTARDFHARLSWLELCSRNEMHTAKACHDFFRTSHAIGPHHKALRCMSARDQVESTYGLLHFYLQGIQRYGSQRRFFGFQDDSDFAELFERMREIPPFATRLSRFDHLEKVSRTHGFYVEPERIYSEGSNNPLAGLTLLLFGQRCHKEFNVAALRQFFAEDLRKPWNSAVCDDWQLPFGANYSETLDRLEGWLLGELRRLIPAAPQPPGLVFDVTSALCRWQKDCAAVSAA